MALVRVDPPAPAAIAHLDDLEAGVRMAVAPAREVADSILSLARSTALHQPFPGRKATAGNLAFPFSPSDLSGGPGL